MKRDEVYKYICYTHKYLYTRVYVQTSSLKVATSMYRDHSSSSEDIIENEVNVAFWVSYSITILK